MANYLTKIEVRAWMRNHSLQTTAGFVFLSTIHSLQDITLTSKWPQWLFTQLFIQAQIKENIKAPRHWPLCGEFPGTGEFPAQMASNAENVSIWWRHHELREFENVARAANAVDTILVPGHVVNLCTALEDRSPVDFIYGYPIFQWVAVTRNKIGKQDDGLMLTNMYSLPVERICKWQAYSCDLKMAEIRNERSQQYVDGAVQGYCIASALAIKLIQSCAIPSRCIHTHFFL